ncbi:MAG: IclR family transcriptional regulator [Clostridium sp.]|uniref:IclR family transcriptional regulator n=1 Tax=Clostridium sp. TaxID=1506 RepID=UPI002FCBEB0A
MKTIQSIDRAVMVLDCISKNNNKLKLTDISEMLNLKVTTLHGIISTLEIADFVTKNPETNKYCLGIRLYELGNIYGESISISKTAGPYLQALVEKYSETVHLAVPTGQSASYIKVIESPHPIRLGSQVGTRDSLLNSSVGKVILSNSSDKFINKFIEDYKENNIDLPGYTIEEITDMINDIKAKGYGFHSYCEGNCFNCVAVAIKNSSGTVVGAIDISVPIFRWKDEMLDSMKTDLIAMASLMSTKL